LPYQQRMKAVRSFRTGLETLRDAGGPVPRFSLGPRWLLPSIVVATSPQGGRDGPVHGVQSLPCLGFRGEVVPGQEFVFEGRGERLRGGVIESNQPATVPT
jgi:hypothetical protein